MYLEKEHKETGCRYLLVLRSNTCFKRKLPDLSEGSYVFSLSQTEGVSDLDEEIVFENHEGSWQINGKTLSGQFPVSYYTKWREKLLFLLSEKIESLGPAGRIVMEAGKSIQIGKAYTNPVFYDYYSLMRTSHVKISCKMQGHLFINTEEEGVYINEKAVKGEKELYAGDRVDIYGLHLLILKNLIICTPFCGVLRIARTEPSRFWRRSKVF